MIAWSCHPHLLLRYFILLSSVENLCHLQQLQKCGGFLLLSCSSSGSRMGRKSLQDNRKQSSHEASSLLNHILAFLSTTQPVRQEIENAILTDSKWHQLSGPSSFLLRFELWQIHATSRKGECIITVAFSLIEVSLPLLFSFFSSCVPSAFLC